MSDSAAPDAMHRLRFKGIAPLWLRPHTVALLGHVDCGKSTLAGHMLYLMGEVSHRELESIMEEAAMSRSSYRFKFAWIMDKTKPERERGITMMSPTRQLSTPARAYLLADCPGHRDFTKNAITCMSGADVALLVVAAGTHELEAGLALDNGITVRHAILAFYAGIRDVVVAVSKMDLHDVAYSQARFNEVRQRVLAHLLEAGFSEANVNFVPCSAWLGVNLVDDPNLANDPQLAATREEMPWYEGPSVLAALGEVSARLTRTRGSHNQASEHPFRMPIDGVFRVQGVGTVVTGVVAAGRLRRGTTVSFSPGGVSGVVRSIEIVDHTLEEVGPGDPVGLNIVGLSRTQVRRGAVCGDASNEHAPRCAVSFTAQVVVLAHPNEIRCGYSPVVDCGTAHVACQVTDIAARTDRASGAVLEQRPLSVRAGDAALLTLVPTKPLCVETFEDCERLGQISIRDMGIIVAVGRVRAVTKSNSTHL